MRALRLMMPFMWVSLRSIATFGFPVFDDTFEPMPQSRLESIDRFTGSVALDLGADEPAVDIQVGLGDHWAGHRRIGVPAQPDPGMQHRLVCEPAEPTDLLLYIRIDTG